MIYTVKCFAEFFKLSAFQGNFIQKHILKQLQSEKYPNAESFLVRIWTLFRQ